MSNKNKRNLQKKYANGQNQVNTGISISSQKVWSAPLPPPEVLNAYEPKVQNAIISGAEEYRHHRIETEKKITNTESFTIKTVSLTYAITTISLLILSAIALMMNNIAAGALIAIIGTAVNLVPKLLSKKDDKNS